MRKLVFALLMSVSFAAYSGAANDPASEPKNKWIWGPNEIEAKGKWMAMDNLIRQKKYNEAASNLSWLLNNTPDLNVALYINAIKVYEKRAAKEKSKTKKLALQDSALLLYGKRIELYSDEAKVLNRKGRVAWKYLSPRKKHNDELHALYSKIHQLNGSKTYAVNLMNLMSASCTQYLNQKMTKAEVIEVYNSVSNTFDLLENKAKTEKKLKKIAKYRGATDQTFGKNVEITCEDIQEQFGAKFAAKPDVKLAKLIVGLSVSKKCLNNDVFYAAADLMSAQKQSTFGIEKLLGTLYSKKGEYEKALVNFNNSLAMTEDSAKTAGVHLGIAGIYKKQALYTKAREHALTALSFNAEAKEAYGIIGDLYFASTGTCKGSNKVQERSIYIAAYNMYVKAGNQAGMSQAKAQFPSVTEMFTYNLKEGDQMNTGCWINENVTLQKR